ncbi:MAG: beta-L-arabinofuranosidase domain-containing protein [Verrucomicrobiota bacterium]
MNIDPADIVPTPYAAPPAFTPLKFGDIKPRGWILAQMERDLRTGFAGRLDELCHEASSDIFVSGRNHPDKLNSKNSVRSSWWNGETEGNWRSGQMMMACLTRDPAAMANAKAYVEHILASQEADGYIGIFSQELRFKGNGELWTQTCLFRGLLAYAEATGDGTVFSAVKRAVDCTIEGYSTYEKIPLSWHDPLYTDVLESLFEKTGDKKYPEFGLRIFHDCPELENFLRQPEAGGKFNDCYGEGHGATVTEAMRMPFWFGAATGDGEYFKMGRELIAAMSRWTLPCGALVSQEMVNSLPDPWNVGYEYCTIHERECTLLKAGRQLGDPADFEAA